MKLSRKLWLSTSFVALLAPGAIVAAQEEPIEWQARNVHEVKEDIEYNENNEAIYTVQYGDTLSVISEALEIDLRYLAEINQIVNVDLIYPDTVLTAQYDQNQRAESITIENPGEEKIVMDVPVNLTPNIELASIASQTTPTYEETVPVVEEVVEAVVIEEVEEVEDTTSNNEIPSLIGDFLGSTGAGSQAPQEDEIVEEELVYEETPVQEDEPVYEETPVQEDEPVYEEAPVQEDEPVYEEAPVQEDEPVYEEAPVQEEPAYEEESELTVPHTPAWEVVEEEDEVPLDVYVEDTVPAESIVEDEDVSNPVVDWQSNPANYGLQDHVAQYKEEVGTMYGIEDYSLYREGDPQDHGQGLAVDFMVYDDTATGDAIAEYSINNMAENNISYVIWKQQIYGDWNHTWTPMEDRGSVTANHYDHVHVSFNP